MSRTVLIVWVLFIYLLCSSLMNIDAKLIGYWTFDDKNELGKDSSPLRNHGKPTGAVGIAKWTRDGIAGGGLLLEDGQESYLEVPHNDSLNMTDQMTLMCWVKFSNVGVPPDGLDQSLIWKNAPREDRRFFSSYALRVFRTKLQVGSFAFEADTTEGKTGTVPADPDHPIVGEWYHVAAVADGAEVKIYTNGKEKAVGVQKGEFRPTVQPLTIGWDLRNPDQQVRRAVLGWVRGIMDEVVILSHALTQDDVKAAMELGEAGKTLENFAPFAVEPEGKLATKWAKIKASK
ncbi:MAG: LamG domain-containing protein [Candidatus Poribacteria bacterium]|nr:LamG domain-containing protein [Candidatus Poribacteria bacterium]